MPHYLPQHVIDPDLAACPIVGLAIDSRQHQATWHTHQRTQLLYLAEGSVTICLPRHRGQLSPAQAIWIPAGLSHQAVMYGRFAYRSLYFETQIYTGLPDEPVVIEVRPLLRELILRVTHWSAEEALNDVQARLVSTLLDELAFATRTTPCLPMPIDRRARNVAQALLDYPADDHSLVLWGKKVGTSGRTLARLFLQETGLSFAQWRTQCRLMMANTWLAEGMSVTTVAHALGYASDSAFIAMYRRVYGQSPKRHRRQQQCIISFEKATEYL